MRPLEMTRVECAKQISRVADGLRYHIDKVADLEEYEDRDQERELTEEIDIRESYHTLVELLKVMHDLI